MSQCSRNDAINESGTVAATSGLNNLVRNVLFLLSHDVRTTLYERCNDVVLTSCAGLGCNPNRVKLIVIRII